MSDEIWERIKGDEIALEKAVETEGLYHRGYRFFPPYACGRCGEPVSARQFAFSRACGACDVGDTRARLRCGDPRWFIAGKAVLENKNDAHLIHPDFVPSWQRKEFAPIKPPSRPAPWVPRVPPCRKKWGRVS